MFANTVKSGGFSVDFVFSKRKTKDISLTANIDLKLEDFGLEEVKQTYQPMFLDPGRKSMFTAAISKDHFYLYQGKQRAAEETVNMLAHGGTKYNKRKKRHRKKKRSKKQKLMANPKEKKNPVAKNSQNWKPVKFQMEREKVPLVVFGARMFGKDSIKLKGNRLASLVFFWRALKRREAAKDLIAVIIDECKTFKVCNACNNDPLTSMFGLKSRNVQVCNFCKALWQRGINACKDALPISLSVWDGKGQPFKHSRN
ncbi:hypothetical protein BCV72DRAFT_315350 [Rhizopus microsporus var. microsporus]|uniref:Uncharacterized protein n=1 Tax=Rhizopus microsporus var. microsporus TaxID=86635 RepID=A0A1X0QUP4_RHIZD|nr:hypothetical protein BCV72DRAFT_315350 [Rhizopus microsporus var. microsporus]